MKISNHLVIVIVSSLLVTIITCYRRYKLPTYITPCHRDDPQINQCVRNVLSEVQKHLPKGIRQFNIPPMDPLVLPLVMLDHGSTFKVVYTNFSVYNIDKFIVDDINLDLTNNYKTAKLTFRDMTVKASYVVDGQLIGLRLKGSGPFEGNFTNVRAYLAMRGSRYMKNGREYFKLDKGTIDVDFGRPSLYFTGLFDGDEKFNQHAVDFINENIEEVLKNLKRDLNDVVEKVAFGFIMRVYDRFSLDELFPK